MGQVQQSKRGACRVAGQLQVREALRGLFCTHWEPHWNRLGTQWEPDGFVDVMARLQNTL